MHVAFPRRVTFRNMSPVWTNLKRRFWAHGVLKRSEFGDYDRLVQELRLSTVIWSLSRLIQNDIMSV